MPPTKHMTGNVFAGYLLDAFFNLCGMMTGQSILLIGMMTEGIHTPFLSDRDLALENVRYVRDAAGRLGESFRPDAGRVHRAAAPARCWARRWRCCGKIGDDGPADRDRRRHVRDHPAPADGGRGLDGVIERADGYFNPATEILEADGPAEARAGSRRPAAGTRASQRRAMTGEIDPAVRRHHRRRPGAALVHAAGPVRHATERARAEGAALQLAAKMGLEPAMVVHAKGMGPDFTFFIVYGRVSHLVDLSQVTVAEREFPLLSSAEVNLRIRSALGRKLVVVGRVHRHRRAHGRASTRS